MWRWATFSSLAAALACAAPSAATTLVTVDEALAAAFPGAEVARETLFLTEEQLAAAEARSGVGGQRALVTRYVATTGGEAVGYAYLDTHVVRTLPETLMVLVRPDGTLERVEVVVFREPMEYLPPDGWYRQLDGRPFDEELALKRGIRPITGATLTARATVDSARRVLAVHQVLAHGTAPP